MDSLPPDLEKLHELCRLRSTLEAFAAVRLHANPERGTLFTVFRAHLERMHRLAKKGDHPGFHRCDMALHRALVDSCGIPSLLASWEKVEGDLEPWIQHIKRVYWPSLMTLYREHLILIDAWASGERWIAENATHHHLEAGWFRVASARGKIPVDGDPVDRATSFISTHYVSRIDVPWIARNVSFVSASHLTRLFRQKLKISPFAFLRQVRMEHAAEALKTGREKISAIAPKCGYRNVSHFVRDFRGYFGTTPKRYGISRPSNLPASPPTR